MALEHALLVSLAERPSSGYDLTRRFDQSISFFWSASHQQIYRTLQRITEAGWATCEVIAQSGKPDKKVYSISALGRDTLADWINEPSSGPTFRWDLLVKMRGLAHGSPEALLKDLRAHREQATLVLEQYRHSQSKHFPSSLLGPSGELSGTPLHQHLVLDGGVRIIEAFLTWCDDILATLEALPPQQPSEQLQQPEQ